MITTLEFPLGIPTSGNPPRDDTKMLKGFRLTDPDGNEVPFAVTHMGAEIRAVLNPHELNLDQWVQRITIEFIAEDVPACGYKVYTITPCGEMPEYPVQSMDALSTSHAYPYLEDTGEVGDEYLHRRPTNDTTCVYNAEGVIGRNYQTNAVPATEMDEADWSLPAGATPDRQGRATEQVVCPTKTCATKWKGVERIEHKVSFDNQARDHRLIARVESVHLEMWNSAFRRPV